MMPLFMCVDPCSVADSTLSYTSATPQESRRVQVAQADVNTKYHLY